MCPMRFNSSHEPNPSQRIDNSHTALIGRVTYYLYLLNFLKKQKHETSRKFSVLLIRAIHAQKKVQVSIFNNFFGICFKEITTALNLISKMRPLRAILRILFQCEKFHTPTIITTTLITTISKTPQENKYTGLFLYS